MLILLVQLEISKCIFGYKQATTTKQPSSLLTQYYTLAHKGVESTPHNHDNQFLVLINIFNTITNLSPNVEGMTAISSWMIACMMFVFFALLGYAGLLYYSLVRREIHNSLYLIL